MSTETLSAIAEEEKVEQSQSPKDSNKYENLLGDLLSFLRKNKLMTLLILCRQITKIEIFSSVAQIYAENEVLDELMVEKNKNQLESYFGNIGLGIKFIRTQTEDNRLNELKFMLGDKLKIN